jgi:hypothetical protein
LGRPIKRSRYLGGIVPLGSGRGEIGELVVDQAEHGAIRRMGQATRAGKAIAGMPPNRMASGGVAQLQSWPRRQFSGEFSKTDKAAYIS